MTEIEKNKGNLYPNIVRSEPSAPVAVIEMNDNGQSFRLGKISEVQRYLEEEVRQRENLEKKYLKISKTVDNVEAIFTVGALLMGGGGIALLSTIVAIPATIALEGCALFIGLLAVVSKFIVRRSRTKSEKHMKIKILAESKLNTLSNHISKAIADNKIEHLEFSLIMEELEKYKILKEEIRNKTKKQISEEEKESLIEKGLVDARNSFRRLVEKNQG